MKKLILSLIAVAFGTLGSFAQDEFVATLNHGSELSTFFGEDALAQAYEAAADGDVITLSPGVFNAVTIAKAITLRGAGFMPMESNGYVSTQIVGDLSIIASANAATALTIEGVELLGNDVCMDSSDDKMASVNFIKSRVKGHVYGTGVNLNAISCIFASDLNARVYNNNTGFIGNTTMNCYNCVINGAQSEGLSEYNSNYFIGKINATNCIVGAPNSSLALPRSELVNCIVVMSSDSFSLCDQCNARNCIGIKRTINSPNAFEDIYDPSNIMLDDKYGEEAFSFIFKTLTSIYDLPLDETFQLTDEAAATYLGDDGTQVGVYGGASPFNPNLTTPQVTKFTVNSTTENGKLKVKINVE